MNSAVLVRGQGADAKQLPDIIEKKLCAARRRMRIVETCVAVCGGLCGLLASYLLLFVSDRFWSTPAWIRFVFSTAGVAAAGAGAWWWASRLRLRGDPRAAARLVQKRYPRLGDRLLSVVELACAAELPPNMSQSLVNAAMRQVAADSAALNFATAVPTRWLRRWSPAFIAAACLAAAVIVFIPAAGFNAWKRWAKPFGAERRFTFAQLDPLDGRRVVPYGEGFGVTAVLRPESRWRPPAGTVRMGRQTPLESALDGNRYEFNIPGQTKAGKLALSVGDARETVRIEPMFRPDIVGLTAKIDLPAYLEYPVQQADARKGTIDLVKGSRVGFEGEISRPLREAALTVSNREPLAVKGSLFRSGMMSLPPDAASVKFEWLDTVGMGGRTPFELKLAHYSDDPPRVECRGLPRAVAILEDETLVFRVEAEDDFGVKSAYISWQVAETAGMPALPDGSLPSGVYEVGGGKPQERFVGAKTMFSPRALGIGPSRVSLYAAALDYMPNRKASESVRYTIVILDRSEHALLIQREMDRISQQLFELARDEQQQVETSQQMRDELARLMDRDANDKRRAELQKQIDELTEQLKAAKAMPDRDPGETEKLEQELKDLKNRLAALDDEQVREALDKLTSRLDEARQAEQENREAAGRTQEKIRDIAKEAVRNEAIPAETMKQMAKLMEALQKLMQGEMQEAQQSLQNAQGASQSSQTAQRSEQMKKAQEEQQAAMEKLLELARQMRQSGEDIMADTFVNRLRAAAKSEQDIGGEIKSLSPLTIGAAIETLPADLRDRVLSQKTRQELTQKKVRNIREDIRFFLRRLPVEVINDVYIDMDKVNVVDELGRLAGLIGNNQSAVAIEQTVRWEKQLREWADRISGRKKDKGDGGGGGGGEQEMPAWLMELVLRLARARQQEEDIREQTRALEAVRSGNTEYEVRAAELGDRQDKLLTEFDNIPEEAGVPAMAHMQLAPLFEQVDNAMGDAILTLRKPDTGGDAIAAETEVIELLGKVLEKAGESGGGGSGQMSQQQMAMLQRLMQMLRMGGGAGGGGGNPMGGGTDSASPAAAGSGTGTNLGRRSVEHGSGRDTASLPVEFRDALSGYFNAIDSQK